MYFFSNSLYLQRAPNSMLELYFTTLWQQMQRVSKQ